MQTAEYSRIPIRAGGLIIAHALVDADNEEWLGAYRWCLTNKGYAARSQWDPAAYAVRNFKMHRDVIGCVRGDGKQVDHINRDKLDNRRANLRIADRGLQAFNLNGRGGTSRFRGVSWSRRRWIAVVSHRGKTYQVGSFVDEVQAGLAAEAFRQSLEPGMVPDAAIVPYLPANGLEEAA